MVEVVAEVVHSGDFSLVAFGVVLEDGLAEDAPDKLLEVAFGKDEPEEVESVEEDFEEWFGEVDFVTDVPFIGLTDWQLFAGPFLLDMFFLEDDPVVVWDAEGGVAVLKPRVEEQVGQQQGDEENRSSQSAEQEPEVSGRSEPVQCNPHANSDNREFNHDHHKFRN